MNIVLVLLVAKNDYSVRFFLFLERRVLNKNKQLLMPHFSLNKFFD